MGVIVTSGLGWSLSNVYGDVKPELELPDGVYTNSEVYDWFDKHAKEDGLEVAVLYYGYDASHLALFAEGSVQTSYDYLHALSTHSAQRAKEPAFRRELLKARDDLGLTALGEPEWLLLVHHG